ncbi:MAG TPA: hypothetical protein VJ508_01020, partial [Saprospiraceae bacterium]|nr:hypothetical protein [Saprospiraceae bacterium]
HTPVGGHTFSSVYKLLEKFGFDVHVETYQVGYRSPVWSNTGTYLREFNGDFGILGQLLGPYLLGLLTSFFWFRVETSGRFIDLSVAAFFFVIVGMSVFVMATRVGALQVYLIGAFVLCYFIDRKPFSSKYRPNFSVAGNNA